MNKMHNSDLRMPSDDYKLKGKKTRCQKYKQSTIDEIYRRLQNPKQYGLDVFEVAKAANFIKPQGT